MRGPIPKGFTPDEFRRWRSVEDITYALAFFAWVIVGGSVVFGVLIIGGVVNETLGEVDRLLVGGVYIVAGCSPGLLMLLIARYVRARTSDFFDRKEAASDRSAPE